MIFSLMMLVALLPLISIAQFSGEPRIIHIPPIKADAGQPITLEARIEGGNEEPTAGYIYHRTPRWGTFRMVEMELDNWNLHGTIPGEDVTTSGIEYYLEAEFPSGDRIMLPLGASGSVLPFKIDVAPVGAGVSRTDPAVEVLSPDPGQRILKDEVIIALLLNQHIRTMNPDSLRLTLNGIDITDRTTISETLVSTVVKRLRPGEHRAALFELKNGRKRRIVGWGFVVAIEEEVRKPAVIPLRGSLSARYDHEDISSRQRDIGRFEGKVDGKLSGLKWGGRFYLTSLSLESKDLQPQNRFLGMVNYEILTVKAGDTQPRFSQFTMWGGHSRGVEVNLKSPHINLDLAAGNMLNKIEGEIARIDNSIDTTYDAGGNILTETNIDTTISPGTYTRWMMAARPGFPIHKYGCLSFNFLKVKDDQSSINYGRNPKDNLVVGSDIELYTPNRRFKFDFEAAISLYNSNIAVEPMSQAEDFEKIIIVNQYFEPLPRDKAILDEDIDKMKLLQKVMDELIRSATAIQTSATVNMFMNELMVGYKTIGRSFRSLGSPSIQTDIKGFSISDRLRLWSNRVYLSIGYDNYQDNVSGSKSKEETLHRRSLSTGLSFYTPPEYPNFNLNRRQYNRENDNKYILILLPDGIEDSTGNPIKDQTATYDFSIDKSLSFLGMGNNLALSYSTSFNEDEYNPDAESKLSSLTMRASSRIGKKLETNLALSRTDQNSFNGSSKVDYNVIAASGRYMLLPAELWLSLGLNLNFARGDASYKPSELRKKTAIDYNRIQTSIGAEYHLTLHHKFRFDAYRTFHSDDGYTEFWDSSVEKEMNKDALPDQDDFVTKIKYTYNF